MQLSKFTLIPPQIKPGDLFQALETVIPPEAVTQTISFAASQAGR